MSNLEIKREVYRTDNGTNAIYDATYLDQPCFAIQHVPTGHIEIIDHNEKIIKAVIDRIVRSKALACDKKEKGYFLKFCGKNRERPITLRYFVYAKYMGVSLGRVRGKNICTVDDSAVKDNVLDLRSCNLYDAGALRPHTKHRDIRIIERPGTHEKYIAISFSDRENRKIEYTEYSPELYEMLARPTYCNLRYNAHKDRATVSVHYSHKKDGYILDNLSRFILIYRTHFERYKKMSGAVKRFIHEYKMLSDKYCDMHGAHINSCKWNNCISNLMFMDAGLNQGMHNWIKLFSEPYRVFTSVNKDGEILIELSSGMNVTKYYLCESPEDYLDWQRVFLGKALTEKLQLAICSTPDGMRQMLTPCGMLAAGEVNREITEKNEPDIWTWLEHRDILLSMSREHFTVWKKKDGQLVIHVPDCAFDGSPFAVSLGDTCAFVRVTPV